MRNWQLPKKEGGKTIALIKNFKMSGKFHPIAFLIILLIGIIVYKNSFNVPFIYDDKDTIELNYHIKGLKNFLKDFSFNSNRPILMLSFALNYEFGGLKLFGYHLVNIVLHIFTSFIVYLIISISIRNSLYHKTILFSYLIPLIASLFYLTHPLTTESVTYLSSRSSILSAFFYIFALFLFIKGNEEGKNYIIYSPLCLIFYLLSIWSKQIGITLPAMVFFYDYFFIARGNLQDIKKRFAQYYFPLIVASFLIVLMSLSFAITLKSPDSAQREFYPHILTEVTIAFYYLKHFLFPINLNFDPYFPLIASLLQSKFILSLFFILLLIFIAKKLFRDSKLISFGIVWFLITISPHLLIRLQDLMCERWLYLPLIGITFFVAGILIKVMEFGSGKHSFLLFCSILLILIFLSAGTIKRNEVYNDEALLWSDAMKKSPDKARPYHNLGVVYLGRNKNDEAIELYKKSISIEPNFPQSYNNLGAAYIRKGKTEKALKFFKIAVKMAPDYTDAINNLINSYFRKNQIDEALKIYKDAIKIVANPAEIHNMLGMTYYEVGLLDNAIEMFGRTIQSAPVYAQPYNNMGMAYDAKELSGKEIILYKKAIEVDPYYAKAYNNLARLYASKGKVNEAIELYKKAIKIDPTYTTPYNNLGIAFHALGKYDEAIRLFKEAIQKKPDYTKAYNNLGTTYYRKGQTDLAIMFYKKAIGLDPYYPNAYNNLGEAYSSIGKHDNAIRVLKKAIMIAPSYANAHNNLSRAYMKKGLEKEAKDEMSLYLKYGKKQVKED